MNSSNKTYIILSPHLDDALLSLGQHILVWKNKGILIKVVNIFTGYGSKENYGKLRNSEDALALFLAKVDSRINLNFNDAQIRILNLKKNPTPITPIYSRQLPSSDKKVVKSLTKKLYALQKEKFDRIYVCYGVGNHLDHLITKKIAEHLFKREDLHYYLDIPYYFNLKNALWFLFNDLLQMKITTVYLASNKKWKLIENYKSQIKLLFKRQLPHFEITFQKK